MTSAIYNLIIPIVSNSYAYSNLAKNLNSEFLVFDNNIAPFDILIKIDNKDNEFFNNFFKKSIQYIDENYSIEFISTKILNLIKISS